jgi:hypothetical protein
MVDNPNTSNEPLQRNREDIYPRNPHTRVPAGPGASPLARGVDDQAFGPLLIYTDIAGLNSQRSQKCSPTRSRVGGLDAYSFSHVIPYFSETLTYASGIDAPVASASASSRKKPSNPAG